VLGGGIASILSDSRPYISPSTPLATMLEQIWSLDLTFKRKAAGTMIGTRIEEYVGRTYQLN